jgi:hypothetical protein
MINSTYQQWKADKYLFGGSLLFFLFLFVLLSSSVYSFLNMHSVQGKIVSVRVDVQKSTYLTVKLAADDKIYYQAYEKRFYDPEINHLHKDDPVRFFTFNSPEKKRAAISSLGDQSNFDYYPIFNINKSAGLLQVIYFYVYNKLILDFLLIVSFVVALYNGFYVFVKANWLIKVPLIALMLAMAWVMVP